MSMRIVMLDPSAFTIPYDVHLCRALSDAGAEVAFLTRPIRDVDYFSRSLRDGTDDAKAEYQTVEHFYRISERSPMMSTCPPLKMGLKGIEHVLNMATLCRLLRRFRPDIIHFQWMVVPGLDRFFVRRLRDYAPVVLTVHDTNAFVAPSSRLQKAGWHAALSGFDRLIVHTRIGKRALMAMEVDERRVSVIPHGVFSYCTQRCGPSIESPKSETCVLLAFGSIKPYKGTDVLIRALAELPETTRSKVRLIIAGNPSVSEKELRALAVESGVDDHIEWILKFIPDEEIPALFQRCHAVVFPYRQIGASGALMTALPYGKAIVASRLGLFDELLRHGRTAMLVEPGNPRALAAALDTIAHDLTKAREMGLRAAQLAKDVCSWDRIAHLTLTAYRDALRTF